MVECRDRRHVPSNKGQWVSEKIRDYCTAKEKNLKWLQDDYVKFICFAQEKIDENKR